MFPDEVIKERSESALIADEFRTKFVSKLHQAAETETLGGMSQRKLLHRVFVEIDADGSGKVDRLEFRELLRKMKVTYSDQRFAMLFRAIDGGGGGDGSVTEQELNDFLFPSNGRNVEAATPGRALRSEYFIDEGNEDERSSNNSDKTRPSLIKKVNQDLFSQSAHQEEVIPLLHDQGSGEEVVVEKEEERGGDDTFSASEELRFAELSSFGAAAGGGDVGLRMRVESVASNTTDM